MRHVGIDAGKQHWISILDQKGKEVVSPFSIENKKADYQGLASQIPEGSKICIENTGSYSLPIYRYLKGLGHDIIMIEGARAKSLREYVKETIKTDPGDAEVLAYIRLLEHLVPVEAQSVTDKNNLKILVRMYRTRSQSKMAIKLRIISIIQKRHPEIINAFYKPACKTVLGVLRYHDLGNLYAIEQAKQTLIDHGFRPAKKNVERVLDALKDSVGVNDVDEIFFHALIDSYFLESQHLEKLEYDIAVELLKTPYALLVAKPNFGLIGTAALVGHVQDISLFPNYKKFVSYCGFRFTRIQSGDMDVSKLRSMKSDLRWAFSSIVELYKIYDPVLKVFSENLKKRGKSNLIIKFAVMRKVLTRLYFEMRKLHPNTLKDNLEQLPKGLPYKAINKAKSFWVEKLA